MTQPVPIITMSARKAMAVNLARYLHAEYHSGFAVGDINPEEPWKLGYVDLTYDQCNILKWINAACGLELE